MKRVLITGATGFIGGRAAEVCFQLGIPAVALVRTWSRAARLARMPLPMVQGDVLDPASLRAAMKGCDVVFHCAVDNRVGGLAHRRSSVDGTANVLAMAQENDVRRVVHLSSVAVYSFSPGPDAATEAGAYRYSGQTYCDSKIDAEKLALASYRDSGLPVVVLRPTTVYGPFSAWTVDRVMDIRAGRMVLVNGGRGVCNSLYIDNLVQAMLLAAEYERAVGEVFHISDATPITWEEFLEAHARALGAGYLPLPEMTAGAIAAIRAQMQRNRPSSLAQLRRLLRDPQVHRALRSVAALERSEQIVRAIGRALLPPRGQRFLREQWSRDGAGGSPPAVGDRTLSIPPPHMVEIYTSNVTFSIDKARRILGYDPQISFPDGMARTAAWIEWARL